MKAKIVIQSLRIDTYVNAIAAIVDHYPEINQFIIVFFDKPSNEDFINKIQKRLSKLSDIPQYARAARMLLTSEEILIESKELLQECVLVDVSGVSKEVALSIAANGIEKQSVKVGHLKWHEKIEKGKEFRVGLNKHSYEDLLSKGAMATLIKKYIAKKHVLRAFVVMFSIIMCMAIAKFIWPQFIIPDDIINLFSLLIGAAGLYLAAISLKGT